MSSSEGDTDVQATFIGETRERIDRLSQCALQIESGSEEGLAAVLADVHGLKGTAAVTGVKELADVSHRLEDVLNAMRSDDSVFADPSELNELMAQIVLDFCDFSTAYCDALASGSMPPLPPTFLSSDDRPLIAAKLKPFRTAHGIEGKLDGDNVSIAVPRGVLGSEFQEAVTNFQQYLAATPRGITWNVDLAAVEVIDLSLAGELFVLQENLRERHGILNLQNVRRSACIPALLERMQRRFKMTIAEH